MCFNTSRGVINFFFFLKVSGIGTRRISTEGSAKQLPNAYFLLPQVQSIQLSQTQVILMVDLFWILVNAKLCSPLKLCIFCSLFYIGLLEILNSPAFRIEILLFPAFWKKFWYIYRNYMKCQWNPFSSFERLCSPRCCFITVGLILFLIIRSVSSYLLLLPLVHVHVL